MEVISTYLNIVNKSTKGGIIRWNKKITGTVYPEAKQFTTPFLANEFANYLDLNAVIYDVGCSYGRTLDELHHLGYRHLIGMDFHR